MPTKHSLVGFLLYTVDMEIKEFREIVWDYYRDHARAMPWREHPSPYNVVVSEFMLQQTQVSRVEPKFLQWIELWPDFASLANAPVVEVLAVWKGLGYNRRALRLQEVARLVTAEYAGTLPATQAQLVALPGIGPGTAGAIMAYAWNQPVVFIETNIRRVFLHHFFSDQDNVPDSELMPLIASALDRELPREWYWALMDYGTYLKSQFVNPNRRSRHYTRQSKFEGSHRQLRGILLERAIAGETLRADVGIENYDLESVDRALNDLAQEGFLVSAGDGFTIKV